MSTRCRRAGSVANRKHTKRQPASAATTWAIQPRSPARARPRAQSKVRRTGMFIATAPPNRSQAPAGRHARPRPNHPAPRASKHASRSGGSRDTCRSSGPCFVLAPTDRRPRRPAAQFPGFARPAVPTRLRRGLTSSGNPDGHSQRPLVVSCRLSHMWPLVANAHSLITFSPPTAVPPRAGRLGR